MILNHYLGDNPNYLYQFDSFYCSKGNHMDGYNITEFSNAGDLSKYINSTDLSEMILQDIILQIMSPLFILKHPIIGFLHSDLKPKNIFVNIINDVTQFKLADFDKSSIFYKNIRFYNDNFNYTIGTVNTTPFELHKSHSTPSYYYYSLKDTNFYGKYIGFHEFIMSNPEGFYASFDIYTFFYSLILETKVYKWMIDNPDNSIWKIYGYLFHENETTEWKKFLRNIDEVNNGLIKGDTTSIKFYWEQFKINAFKLRYHIEELYDIIGINLDKIKKQFPKETIDLIQSETPKKEVYYISYDNHLCTIEPDKDAKECNTNIYSKVSKDPRDKGYSYIYNYDFL
jgi:serine/threonine protein kinase